MVACCLQQVHCVTGSISYGFGLVRMRWNVWINTNKNTVINPFPLVAPSNEMWFWLISEDRRRWVIVTVYNHLSISASTSYFHIKIELILISILINKLYKMITEAWAQYLEPVYTYFPESSLVWIKSGIGNTIASSPDTFAKETTAVVPPMQTIKIYSKRKENYQTYQHDFCINWQPHEQQRSYYILSLCSYI
jgi:hypothetical protein